MKTWLCVIIAALMLSCEDPLMHETSSFGKKNVLLEQNYYLGIQEYHIMKLTDEQKIYRIRGSEFLGIDNRLYNFNDLEVSFLKFESRVVMSSEYNGILYELFLNLENESFAFFKNAKLVNNRVSDLMVQNVDSEIYYPFVFLVTNYLEMTDSSTARITYESFRNEISKSSNAKMYDGCKKNSIGLSTTKSDASLEASSSSPGASCSRSGEPGCLCATGIWGGEILCTCVQVWNCYDEVVCLNFE